MEVIESDVRLAARIATEAGAMLLALQRSPSADPATLGSEGDARANSYIMRAIREARGDDAILSEEETDSPARLAARRVWIVDPLDGTREFSEGRDDWAVHVALAIDGIATVGAVALPSIGKTLSSSKPPKLKAPGKPLRIVVSRTRPAAQAMGVADALGAKVLPMGSAGAKAMAVVMGNADIYLHAGGQYEWDSCAPVAVALAAGLHCSRIDGSPLIYNRDTPFLPDLLICQKSIAGDVLALVKADNFTA